MRISIGSISDGQVYMGTNWLKDLHENINTLNRNLQQNMYQLQQRIHNTVQRNLEHVHRLTENLGMRLGVKFSQFLFDSSYLEIINLIMPMRTFLSLSTERSILSFSLFLSIYFSRQSNVFFYI